MAYLNFSDEDEVILSKAWASVAAEKDWSPEAIKRERDRLDRFMEITEKSCRPKKIVYVFEIEYSDVLVFSDKAKAIQKAMDYLGPIFKDKFGSDLTKDYIEPLERWLDRDGETGSMGIDGYPSCYIYRREISD